MKAAECRQCGRHSMAPIDAHEAEEALSCVRLGVPQSCRLECAYCGGQQSTLNAAEIEHAFCEESEIRRRVQEEVGRERQKLARLQEGRW